MPSMLPDGDPAPADGALPAESTATLVARPFGIYLHVPFCSVRCGYCDFNTYTLTELGADGASVATFADAAVRELRFAGRSSAAPARWTRSSSAGDPDDAGA